MIIRPFRCKRGGKDQIYLRIGDNGYGENQDPGNPQHVRERQERRLRRVPDLLPVCLQDQLRRGQSAVREQVIQKSLPPSGGTFYA